MRQGFEHEASFYEGDRGFVERCTRFALEAIEADEACLIAVVPEKIEMLRDELGSEASRVMFRDMASLGRNPARIIPMWREFADAHGTGGRRVRGIGEPIWAGRGEQALIESQRHEELINLAFQDVNGWILCPYDTTSLDASVIEEACKSHPLLESTGARRVSDSYLQVEAISQPYAARLPAPPVDAVETRLSPTGLEALRAFVGSVAAGYGLDRTKRQDLILAANEVAANTFRHGDGQGVLRMWADETSVTCEVTDGGHISDPLIGRHRSTDPAESGLGLWIVNQVCDLVQVRSLPSGTVVRMHMTRPS